MLHIQDPIFTRSYSTHEALINTCSSSIAGYGAFAFASATGVELLFNDEVFDALLERGEYSLVLGIDEITNAACLESLDRIQQRRPSLNVQAFLHDEPSLFHPKFSFFKNEEDLGSLIVGSGNLTLGGLRKNREGFAVIELEQDQTRAIESYWSSWLAESGDRLRPISDDLVIQKVRQNQLRRRAGVVRRVEREEESESPEVVASGAADLDSEWSFSASSKVLFAEIPRSGDRWKQANFDVGTFQEFFGAIPGDNSQRVLLRNVNADGTLAHVEVRQSVSVKSQNYRFELDAASGISYPDTGKPIGIFVQVSTRVFLYHLFLPGDSHYETLVAWMDENWDGRADRMKRIVAQISDVESMINETVFSQYKGW
ncbi:hypothetical protein SAMN04487965_0604 [Microbulbifer donghaiensis]|uniref:HKD family nuclease n=1 Tax=Microbulbifer donghaiensis TaxID=494016 RepID=A0A1M4W5I5_9GAMM|nr:phospholipase D family protein [Microbulbifer donghaiensis]SHE76469.1 hypothetical protein SAMN04487965_0604 [Microbulbifer donghaiensis]